METVFAMFGPNLGFSDVSSWLYTQFFTYNPILQSELAKSLRETRNMDFIIRKTYFGRELGVAKADVDET